MTEQELKQSGRQGVYRADLDDFFYVGEDPAPVTVTESKVAAPIPVATPVAPVNPIGVPK